MLKEKLLNLGIFKDNNYLDSYIKLINNNKSTIKQKNTTECHHIIPKVYFKYMKLPIDNSAENLVNLYYCDHVLAHCLLALSFNDKYLVSASLDSIYAVLNSFQIYKTLEDFIKDYEEVKDIIKCNHFISDTQKSKLGQISAASRWYNNGEKETFNRVCPEGWVPGRLKRTEEQKAKTNKLLIERNKKSHWYNNGKICVFVPECPEGFKPGRIMTDKLLASQKANGLKNSEKIKNNPTVKRHGPYIPISDFRWFNNGIIEIRATECPEGFKPGRLEQTKQKISSAKLNKAQEVI